MVDDLPGKPLPIELVPEGEFPVALFAVVHLLPATLVVPNTSLHDGTIVTAVGTLHANPIRKITVSYL